MVIVYPDDGHFHYFQSVAIISNASVNNRVHLSLFLEVEIMRHMVYSFVILKDIDKLPSINVVPTYTQGSN